MMRFKIMSDTKKGPCDNLLSVSMPYELVVVVLNNKIVSFVRRTWLIEDGSMPLCVFDNLLLLCFSWSF